MSLASPSNIQFVSTYPTDKIVNVFQGSFDAGAATDVGGYLKRYSFAHGYTRPVFTKLVWSTDNVTYIDGGFSFRSGDASQYPSIAYSDSSNIYILTGVTSGTIYYKVIAFWINDYDASNPLVSSYMPTNSDILFDSRLNYQKIYTQGEVTVTGLEETETITHNLGYKPNVRVFFESFSGQVWPAIYGGVLDYFLYDFTDQGEVDVQIKDNTIDLNWLGTVSTTNRKIWYRVYLDS